MYIRRERLDSVQEEEQKEEEHPDDDCVEDRMVTQNDAA
jgi:hypothetical protein